VQGRWTSRCIASAAVVAVLGAVPAASTATPIPEGSTTAPEFIGSAATPNPVAAPEPPRHPFMAPNGKSEIHSDAYQSDTNSWSGPLGRTMERVSTFQGAECASHTFDSRGRIVTICVGLEGPRLLMLDPDTLDLLASFPLPPRQPGGGNPLSDFSGGGYFYLDDRDRAVIPTTNRQVWIVRETQDGSGFELERTYDLNGTVTPDDRLLSALPAWSGRIWFASGKGVVGSIDPATGTARSRSTGETISNSFAVDETGGVFIVTDTALYRFDPAGDGRPLVSWRVVYPNTHQQKPGQTQAGSGTTPTLMGKRHVAITDNADPMNVTVYRRERNSRGRRICAVPVFQPGQSATDNSLIGTDTAMVVENNYGYGGPTTTQSGGTVPGGVERVDINADGNGCTKVWHSDERAPSVVPKLSRGNGLVYVYTKDPQPDNSDTWYLTAIDFRTGSTIWKRLAGEGLGYNNNYAPITLGENGTAYVGVLGGLVALRDGATP
jgi:hypothetical protein